MKPRFLLSCSSLESCLGETKRPSTPWHQYNKRVCEPLIFTPLLWPATEDMVHYQDKVVVLGTMASTPSKNKFFDITPLVYTFNYHINIRTLCVSSKTMVRLRMYNCIYVPKSYPQCVGEILDLDIRYLCMYG